MKQIVFILLVTLTFTLAEAQNKEKQLLESAVTQLNRAMIGADEAELDRLSSDKLSYGHSSWLIEDKSAFIAAIVDGSSRFTEIDLSEQTISLSGDIALVRHKFSASTANKGQQPGTVNLGVLQIWQKDGGKWVLLARQATKLP